MQLIKEISRKDFDSSFKPNPKQKYTIRRAARAILIKDGTMAILNVSKQKLHKIPGGGVEEGEDIKEALLREILEEAGCNATIERELGMTIEYRDEFEQIQISYVFVATVVGEPHSVNYTQDELDDGFQLEWVSIDQVLGKIEKDNPEDYADNKYMSLRDKEIIKFYLAL